MGNENEVNKRAVILQELSELVSKGVIGEGTALKIREYYGEIPRSKKHTGIEIFTALGALLVGLGVILLIAHNWGEIPRQGRAALSIAPVILALLASFMVIKKKDSALFAREGAAAFWFLSIGASISLVSQTYGLYGELNSLLFMWLILGIPVMYVMKSSFAYFLYLAFVIWWASEAQNSGGDALFFWGFMAAAMPHFAARFKSDRYSGGVIRNSLITAVAFTIGTGVAMEKCLPGLWIVVYASLFSVLYMSSGMLYSEREAVLRRPFQWYSVIAAAILVLMFTYKWPWEEIGFTYYRSSGKFREIASFADYLVSAGLFASALLLLRDAFKSRKTWLIDFGIAPVIALIGYLIVSFTNNVNNDFGTEAALLIMNAYAAYLAVRTIIAGVHLREMAVVNGGMVMAGALILMRFFDLEMGLLSRGIAFIATGTAILIINRVLVQKLGVKYG